MTLLTIERLADFALSAGRIHMRHWSDDGVPYSEKADMTRVTQADLGVRDLIKTELRPMFPEVSIITEETQENEGDSLKIPGAPFVFHIDELDGTLPFSWGRRNFCFMLGVCYRGKPVMSVIYAAAENRMYIAEVGKGALCNGRRLKVSGARKLAGQTVVVETSPRTDPVWQQFAPKVFAAQASAVNHMSIGFEACGLAEGHHAGLFFPGKKLHDSCAPSLLLKESGAIVSDMNGAPPDFRGDKADGLIAGCTTQIYQQLWDMRQACRLG